MNLFGLIKSVTPEETFISARVKYLYEFRVFVQDAVSCTPVSVQLTASLTEGLIQPSFIYLLIIGDLHDLKESDSLERSENLEICRHICSLLALEVRNVTSEKHGDVSRKVTGCHVGCIADCGVSHSLATAPLTLMQSVHPMCCCCEGEVVVLGGAEGRVDKRLILTDWLINCFITGIMQCHHEQPNSF